MSLGTVLVSLGMVLFYRAIARQNHLYMLRRHIAAAKRGDTFEVLKISGQAWFLRWAPFGLGRERGFVWGHLGCAQDPHHHKQSNVALYIFARGPF